MIEYECPYCSAEMSSPDSMAGEYETCPNCRAKVKVPKIELIEEPVVLEPLETDSPAAPALPVGKGKQPSLPRRQGRQPSLKDKVLCYTLGVVIFLAIVGPVVYWIGRAVSGAVDVGMTIVSDIAKDIEAREKKRKLVGCKFDAWICARSFVRRCLVCPSSADFGYQSSDKVVRDLGGGYYYVNAFVDSQNLFGAKIRNRFVLILQHIRDDQYRLISGPEFYPHGGERTLKAFAITLEAAMIAANQRKVATTQPTQPAGPASSQ